MSRIEIPKMELWDNEIPSVCMVCGEAEGQTAQELSCRYTSFPWTLLGGISRVLTRKQFILTVPLCGECKDPFATAVNMRYVWDGLLALIPVVLLFSYSSLFSDMGAKAFLVPIIFALAVVILKVSYEKMQQKRYDIRCVGMNDGTLTLDLPNDNWNLVYEKYKARKREQDRTFRK